MGHPARRAALGALLLVLAAGLPAERSHDGPGAFFFLLPFIPVLPAAAATKLEDHPCYLGAMKRGDTVISCSGKGLSGTIPPALGKMTALTELYLSMNRLTGPIPPELGALTALTELDLRENRRLTGCVPRGIALCASGINDNGCSITYQGTNPEVTGLCPTSVHVRVKR